MKSDHGFGLLFVVMMLCLGVMFLPLPFKVSGAITGIILITSGIIAGVFIIRDMKKK